MNGEAKFTNIAKYIHQAAEKFPAIDAIRFQLKNKAGWHKKTFSELDHETNQIAHYFRTKGIKPEMRVLLAVKPGVSLIEIVFALFKLGAVPVIIDPGMGLKNFLSCVRQSSIEAVIGIPKAILLSRVFYFSFKEVTIRIPVKEKSFLQTIQKEGHSIQFTTHHSKEKDLAAILFTSGSTGAPKGVCYEHGMFDAQIKLIQGHYQIVPGEIDLPLLPVFSLFNPALGMTTVVPPINPSKPITVNPHSIVQAIVNNNITSSFGSPALWEKITRYCEEQNTTLPSIQRILMAGASVSPKLMERVQAIIPNGIVHAPYGATEALPVASIDSITRKQAAPNEGKDGLGTLLGKAINGISVKIIKSSHQALETISDARELPHGEIGEIIACGPTITHAYYNNSSGTQAAKINGENGTLWHRLGDIGYIDNAGYLWFLGRKAELVIHNESTYYPEVIEGIFREHPFIKKCALIGLGHLNKQKPALVVELHPEYLPKSVNEHLARVNEIRTFAGEYPFTQVIQHIFLHPNIPVDRRHNAKIHRLALSKYFNKKLKLSKWTFL